MSPGVDFNLKLDHLSHNIFTEEKKDLCWYLFLYIMKCVLVEWHRLCSATALSVNERRQWPELHLWPVLS